MLGFLKKLFDTKKGEREVPPSQETPPSTVSISGSQLAAVTSIKDSTILETLAQEFNRIFHKYNITDEDVAAKFIAQVAHESGGFLYKEENLRYSKERLLQVFGKYFTEELAEEYARKPKKIASRVYANRMGNGPEETCDGWTYRGRGYIQLTGKNNYSAFARDNDMTMSEAVRYISKEGSLEVAAWFFDKNDLWNLEMKRMTKLINGGLNGLAARVELYEKMKEALAN